MIIMMDTVCGGLGLKHYNGYSYLLDGEYDYDNWYCFLDIISDNKTSIDALALLIGKTRLGDINDSLIG